MHSNKVAPEKGTLLLEDAEAPAQPDDAKASAFEKRPSIPRQPSVLLGKKGNNDATIETRLLWEFLDVNGDHHVRTYCHVTPSHAAFPVLAAILPTFA